MMMEAVGIRGAVLGLSLIAATVDAAPWKTAQRGVEHGGAAAREGGGEHAGRGMDGSGGMDMSMARHRLVRRNGLPEAYRSMDNPLAATGERLAAGERLYQAHCSACHGRSGRGDGPAAESLDPRPANVARFARMPMASDAYLYWTIAEGGAPVGSPMPSYRGALEEEQIWQLMLYLRAM